MAQHLKRITAAPLREKRRAAAAHYFDMAPDELEKLLRDPKEQRRALVFILSSMKLLLGTKNQSKD